MKQPLLKVENLSVEFTVKKGIIHAVDGTSFRLEQGKTLGIIGESGCGKSVTARAILNMVPKPGRITSGLIEYSQKADNGKNKPIRLDQLDPEGKTIRKIRGGEISMIFQEPMSSLTPVYTIGNHIWEALRLHGHKRGYNEGSALTKKQGHEIAVEMLAKVGIPRPKERINSYPHELSGGQRQRVMIAIALSCNPSILIADEPTTALDVSIEAQILALMKEIQQDRDMSIIFITHNLGVVVEVADMIAVMYLGKIVEYADTRSIFKFPRHPYTKALLQSIPHIGKKTSKRLKSISGMVPDPFSLPAGCHFSNRCEVQKKGLCDVKEPLMQEYDGHWSRCHFSGR